MKNIHDELLHRPQIVLELRSEFREQLRGAGERGFRAHLGVAQHATVLVHALRCAPRGACTAPVRAHRAFELLHHRLLRVHHVDVAIHLIFLSARTPEQVLDLRGDRLQVALAVVQLLPQLRPLLHRRYRVAIRLHHHRRFRSPLDPSGRRRCARERRAARRRFICIGQMIASASTIVKDVRGSESNCEHESRKL